MTSEIESAEKEGLPDRGYDGETQVLDSKTRLVSSVSPGDDKSVDQLPKVFHADKNFELFEEIARGGMGIIFRAHDHNLDRNVAIKLIQSKHMQNRDSLDHFDSESRLMALLRHPGVPEIYDRGVCEDGRPFFTMKLIDGENLEVLMRDAPADTQFARFLNIFASVCQTLAYTHANGVAHHDLKPANIMVGAFGEVSLMDWGLASFYEIDSSELIRRARGNAHDGAADGEHDVAQDGAADEATNGTSRHSSGNRSLRGRVQGTLKYMSPEQARGEPVGPRADVFSLGAILFEILTGAAPYQHGNWKTVYRMARKADLAEAFSTLDSCPADTRLVRLARNCLSANPQDRPHDAEAVAMELAGYNNATLTRVENDMSRFFELSYDLFCIAGFDGHFRRINRNFSRVLGYSDRELLARPFMDFVHPEDRLQTARQMRVLQDGQPVVRFRNRWRASDGRYLIFEWTAKSIAAESVVFAAARYIADDSEVAS